VRAGRAADDGASPCPADDGEDHLHARRRGDAGIWAQKTGMFERNGLDVQIEKSRNGTAATAAVMAAPSTSPRAA